LGDSDVDLLSELRDEIQTFNYAPLVKVIFWSGIPRIVEDKDVDNSYTDH
jgi:hypothetical protein